MGAPLFRLRAPGLWLACLALGPLATRAVRADDPTARERFLKDGDAKALMTSLGSSSDARDRVDAALARLAADPGARVTEVAATVGPPDGGYPSLPAAVDALREMNLARATEWAIAADRLDGGVPAAWVKALVLARAGDDEGAVQRVLDLPAVVPIRDEFSLSLVSAALPPDDRDLLGAIVRLAALRVASQGGLGAMVALSEGAAALGPVVGTRVLVIAARALRRADRVSEALTLLTGTAAWRAGLSSPALRLERAILHWRRGDAKSARAEAISGKAPAEFAWAFEALAKAADCCRLVPAPSPPMPAADTDLDAAVLARFATLLGVKARAEEVSTRAAAGSTSPSDPAFIRTWLNDAGLAVLEVAGDASVAQAAVAKGLPVLQWTIRWVGGRFRDHPVIVRGVDANTGLWLVDEMDPEILDLLPMERSAKSRLLIAVPASRAQELEAWRSNPSARVGGALCEALSSRAAGGADAPASALAAKAAEFPGAAVVDLYLGYTLYLASLAKDDRGSLAMARASFQRSITVPPALAIEQVVVAQGLTGPGKSDRVGRSLDEAAKVEGDSANLHVERYFSLFLEPGRYPEALAALEAARALDPLDTNTLFYRAWMRWRGADRVGARADYARVLDRRPDHVEAVVNLAEGYLLDEKPDEALAVVLAMVKRSPASADSPKIHDLRKRVESKLAQRPRSPADLQALATSPEGETRALVAWGLAQFETPDAEAGLRALLRDPVEGVRVTALRAYKKPWMRDRVASDAAAQSIVLGLLASDAKPNVRAAAAELLGPLDVPAAREGLALRLAGGTRDGEPAVRAAIADALTGQDSPVTRRALVAALSDDDAVVRRAAIGAVRRMADTTNGYVADAPPAERAAAVRLWEDWARQGK